MVCKTKKNIKPHNKTHKGHKKTHKKTHKKRNNNKLVINIDFTKDDYGFQDLQQSKLLSFMHNNIKKGNNLIQTQDNKPFKVTEKNKLYLQAVPVKKWNTYPSWREIKCKSYNKFIKISPCTIGMNNKIFVKLRSNPLVGGLATYLMAIQLCIIDEKKHKSFIKALKYTFGKKYIYIHNTDVDWFHLKEYKS
uniref:Uncharacterized protein n=1 Tax=viral metagenome TaxID=1070528 RepID=A0A6C0KGH7_9ZZZZ